MKKNPIFLLAALFLFSCQSEEKKEEVYNDLFNDNLKGEIIMVESTPYLVDSTGKMGEMDSCCIVVDEYDNGYIVKSTRKEKSGDIKSVTTLTHYDNGLMKSVDEMENGKQTSSLQIEIDSSNKYIGARHTDSTGNLDVFYKDLEQDKYGNVIAGKSYNADSSFKSEWKSKYDNQFFVGSENKDSTGTVIFSSTVKVNDKGDRISMTTMSKEKDSTTNKSYTYQYVTYDDKGNWIERTDMEDGKPVKIRKRIITYATKE